MAIAVTVDPATSASEPHAVTVTGLAAGQVVTFARSYGDTVERIAGAFTADSGGVVAQPDFLYPFDVAVTYLVYDSAFVTFLAQSAAAPPVPSGDVPWVRDVLFPSLRYAPVIIVDVTGRSYEGRVTPYYAAGQPYAVTTGDVRSASIGTLQLLCRSHTERDAYLFAMSSGNPCLLRVPSACRERVDEMTFTPQGIEETRFGTHGACLLSVEFVEVSLSEVGTFQGITYAQQTQNATATDLRYGQLAPPPASGLALAFVGRNYYALALSPTGVAP